MLFTAIVKRRFAVVRSILTASAIVVNRTTGVRYLSHGATRYILLGVDVCDPLRLKCYAIKTAIITARFNPEVTM